MEPYLGGGLLLLLLLFNSQEVEPYLGGDLLLGDLFSFGDCVPRRHPVKETVMDGE